MGMTLGVVLLGLIVALVGLRLLVRVMRSKDYGARTARPYEPLAWLSPLGSPLPDGSSRPRVEASSSCV
jgi:hypothetical protein